MLCARLEDPTSVSKYSMSNATSTTTAVAGTTTTTARTTSATAATTPTTSSVVAAAAAAAAAVATASGTCCETGRPILADPITGQTVCSCQCDPHHQQQQQQQQLLNYQRFTSGLPINVYGSPYGDQAYLPLTAEQSAFYTPTDNLGTWPYPASVYYPYDPTLSGYPFANGYGVDLNGARRKNATRETTSTLKAWLSEHRKNPYPTKGEKIMLAIITKMTLTQVSTWFANARRRLKKENKVTWEPRNRVDDDDDDDDANDDVASDTNEREKDLKNNGMTIQAACDKPSHLRTCDRPRMNGHSKTMDVEADDDADDINLCRSGGGPTTMQLNNNVHQRDFMSSPGSSSIMSDSHSSLQSPDSPGGNGSGTGGGGGGGSTVMSGVHGDNHDNPLKPRIWSIVDTATSHNNSNNPHAVGQHGNGQMFATMNNSYGGGNNNNNHHPIIYDVSGYGVSSSAVFPAFRGGSGSAAGGVTSGGGASTTVGSGPAVKVSQQLVRNLRLGFTSPYTNAAWFTGMTSMSGSSSSAPGPPSSQPLPPPPPPSSSASPPSAGFSSYPSDAPPSTFTASATVSMNQDQQQQQQRSSAPPTTTTTTTAYPAGGASTTTTMSMNSALFGRTYAQTIQNLSNLSKGLNHLMTPPQFAGPRTSPVHQDQRSDRQNTSS